jgi:GMP synthase-like glutamine amidotransferase
MRIHIIQHMPLETAGFLSKWANQPTNFVTVSHPYQTEWYPALECFDLCIVLGGSMSAKDTQKEFMHRLFEGWLNAWVHSTTPVSEQWHPTVNPVQV